MPQILISWFFTLLAALLWGRILELLPGRIFPEKRPASLWLLFWMGLAFITFILSVFTFFRPLTAPAKMLLWLGFLLPAVIRFSLISSLFFRIKRQLSLPGAAAWLLFLFCAGTGLLKSAGLPEIFDEGAYHLPLIRMWEQQGLVPGIANINGHYGLHSGWHLLSAFTNLDFIPGFTSEMSLNGLLAALLGLFAASRIQTVFRVKKEIRISAIMAAALPVFLFRNLLSSPSTDIPAIIGSWFFFVLWLEEMEQGHSLSSRWDLFLILPLWIVLVKSSSAGLLAAPAFFVWMLWKQGRKKALVFSILAGLAMAGIWVLQNWLISGYAVFPVKITALGNPEWQVPASSIQKKFYLEQFGAFSPPDSYTLSWLSAWMKAQNVDSRLIILLAASFLLLFPLFFRRNKTLSGNGTGFWLLLMLQAGIWFFTITEPRYGFGALVISALFVPAFFLQQATHRQALSRFLMLAVLPLTALNFYKTFREYRTQEQSIFTPAAVPGLVYRQVACGNFEASCPQSYSGKVPAGKPVFCWDCPFPCLPLEGIEEAPFIFQKKNVWFTYYAFKNPEQ